jgi:hypothetical protein
MLYNDMIRYDPLQQRWVQLDLAYQMFTPVNIEEVLMGLCLDHYQHRGDIKTSTLLALPVLLSRVPTLHINTDRDGYSQG